jgi:hypothetical protein
MASTMSHPLCFDVRKVEEKQLCRGPLKIQFYNSPRLGLAVPLNLIIKGFFFFFCGGDGSWFEFGRIIGVFSLPSDRKVIL